MTLPEVPRPLLDAAKTEARKVLTGETSAAGIVTALVGCGVLTLAQGDALVGLLGLIPGVVALGGAVWAKARAAYRTFETAEPEVTPVVDPAVELDGQRVPLVVAPATQADGYPLV